MPVHFMSCTWPLLVTAHQSRLIHVWDLEYCFQNNQFQPTDIIESQLTFATSAINCFADGKGFCVGSIEGRSQVRPYIASSIDKGIKE